MVAKMVYVVTHIFFEIQTRLILVLPFVSDNETQLNMTHPVSGTKQKTKAWEKRLPALLFVQYER